MTELPRLSIARLSSLSLDGSGFRRDAPVPKPLRPAGFDAAFDSETFWYDAVHVEDRVLLVMPRLFNLATLSNDASLSIDGARARIVRHWRHRRHEVIALRCSSAAPLRVGLKAGRWHGESAVSPDQTALFAGLNASLHISRNNDLRWIADWARFHVSAHGLQAMLVMDNRSDAYGPEAILEALAPTGLERAVVLDVPQPYGPPRSKSHPGTAKFLQPAMLNLARLRFLSRARAVLNADIDELVWTTGGSVFDAAVASRLGYVSYKGTWRLPARQVEPQRDLVVHRDHVLTRKGGKTCPTKYCVVPTGPIGRMSWDVHRPEWSLLPSRWLHPDLGYWHCQAITTNWKHHDRLKPRGTGPIDPATEAALARHLP